MGLKISANLAEKIRGGASLGFACEADGTVTSGFSRIRERPPYPTPGYLPWNRLEVGNGDAYGFYWPLGREADPPLVCTTMHDCWTLVPLASGLCEAIRLHLVSEHDFEGEWAEMAAEFSIAAGDVGAATPEEAAEQDGTEGDPVPYWGVKSVRNLLPIDGRSPHLLLQAGLEARSLGQWADAEQYATAALDVLPEYTAAWWLLVELRRRRLVGPELVDAILNCITCPYAFGPYDRKKCLHWLQRLPESADPGCVDPLWRLRKELTFAEGVYDHPDYEVYEGAIEEYHLQGLGIRAVRLRVLYGELMSGETVSFRERKGFTWPAFYELLRQDCERANLHARLAGI